MSKEFEDFIKAIKRARFLKKIDDYLEYLENNFEKFLTNDNNNQNDNCDEILVGKWIDLPVTKNKIHKFRIELAAELLPIMNALVRAAIEEYVKRRGFEGVGKFYKDFEKIICKYSMYYNEDHALNNMSQFMLDPLDINWNLRNKYLHYLEKPKKSWNTAKKHKEVLRTRVYFSFLKKEVTFCINERQVCNLLDTEKKRLVNCRYSSLTIYYAEFLVWRLKNVIEEIDKVK